MGSSLLSSQLRTGPTACFDCGFEQQLSRSHQLLKIFRTWVCAKNDLPARALVSCNAVLVIKKNSQAIRARTILEPNHIIRIRDYQDISGHTVLSILLCCKMLPCFSTAEPKRTASWQLCHVRQKTSSQFFAKLKSWRASEFFHVVAMLWDCCEVRVW